MRGLTRRVLRVSALMLVVYGGLIGLTYFQFARTPSGFIPPLDRGYFITAITLAAGRKPRADRRRDPQGHRRSCCRGRASPTR